MSQKVNSAEHAVVQLQKETPLVQQQKLLVCQQAIQIERGYAG